MSEPAAAPGAPYLFRCLGPVAVTTAAGVRVGLRTRKQTALLLYLARHAGRPQGREHLVDLLWADQDERRARHSLAQAISLTNKSLGGDAIRFAGKDQVVLRAGTLWTDVDAFETAAAEGRHAEARALWRGDLLAGLWIERASRFDAWLENERQRLRHGWRDVLHAAVNVERAAGDWSAMRATAQELLDVDALDESAMLACVEAISLAGDRTLALRRYDEFEARLRAELHAEPGVALAAWARRFRRGDAASPVALLPSRVAETIALPAARPFFGREAEFGMLWEAWGAAQVSHGSFVILEGAAGIGKSALAVKLATQAHVAGGSVCFARCFRTEKSVPFAPITALLRQLMRLPGFVALSEVWIGELSRLVPELRERYPAAPSPMAIDDSARHRICDATLQAAACVADEQPLLIVVDDIQDADEATLALLHYFGRQTVGQPTLLLCISRSNAAESELERTFFETARSTGIARFLELGALGLEQSSRITRQILAQRGLDAPDWALARLHETRHGNPLLMIEAAMALPAREGRGDDDWIALLRAHLGAEPESFEQMSGERLTALPGQARQVAAVLAAAGRPVSDYELTAVSGLPTTELASAVFALESANFVRRVGGTLGFAHDRYRESAAIQGTEQDRKAIHLRLAHLLVKSAAENPAARYEVAQHFEAAGQPEEAKEQALQAAKYAGWVGAVRERASALALALHVSLGFDQITAADLGACLLDLRSYGDLDALLSEVKQHTVTQELDREFRYLAIAADHHSGLSALPETRGALESLLFTTSQRFRRELDASLLLLRLHDKIGDHLTARRVARFLRRSARSSPLPAAKGYRLLSAGFVIGKYYSPVKSLRFLTQAVTEAQSHSDWGLEIVARDGLGAMLKQLGRYDESMTQIHFSIVLSRKTINPHAEANGLCNLAVTEMAMGSLREAERHLSDVSRICERFPNPTISCYQHLNHGELLMTAGRLAEAESELRLCVAHTVQLDLWPVTLLACGLLGVVCARKGDLVGIATWTDQLRRVARGREAALPARYPIEAAIAWDLCLNKRDPARALAHIGSSAQAMARTDVDHWLRMLGEGVRMRELTSGVQDDVGRERLTELSAQYGVVPSFG